jgi:uncharacterized membrane-anchored protein YhcB (DUF1043 family)
MGHEIDTIVDLQLEINKLTQIKDKFKKRAKELKKSSAKDKAIVDVLYHDYPKIYNSILDYCDFYGYIEKE